ncbi:hypothetical protein ACIQ9J_01610 [Streptomyces sp. NPDC094153]|uniref:hypothetical protein n=1 Tax=Streptomyces sp. NPDC094153 TaxID=3366058 RepID=UPI00382EA383
MTDTRHTANTITDTALDELYAQRDRARDALRHLMRYLPNHTEPDEQRVDRTPPPAVRQLVDAIADVLPEWDPAEERDFVWRHYQLTHRVLTRRTERAEAAIDRVRQLCADPVHHLIVARIDVLAALDGPEQPKPQPPAQHIGGRANAEDCPACTANPTPPPYPFTCPGPESSRP